MTAAAAAALNPWFVAIGAALAWGVRELRHWRLRREAVKADVVAQLIANQASLQGAVNVLQQENITLHRQVSLLNRALAQNGIAIPEGA